MYVCICKSITDAQIRSAVNEGACSMRDLCQNLGTCSQCGKCAQHVLSELRQALSDAPPASCASFPIQPQQEAA
jgi:bacterioferritin-associated ferredoxin